MCSGHYQQQTDKERLRVIRLAREMPGHIYKEGLRVCCLSYSLNFICCTLHICIVHVLQAQCCSLRLAHNDASICLVLNYCTVMYAWTILFL